jgi:hypothetical protein
MKNFDAIFAEIENEVDFNPNDSSINALLEMMEQEQESYELD